MTASACRIWKISARAFVHPNAPGGGNPVTVFLCSDNCSVASTSPLNADTRVALAKTCEWESVIVQTLQQSQGGTYERPIFYFYLPSGEEVSFCAHAAIGACVVMAAENNISGKATLHFETSRGAQSFANVNGMEAEIRIDGKLEETQVRNVDKMSQLLDQIGLTERDVDVMSGYAKLLWLNSSVARPKTLIPMASMDQLHRATSPKDADKFMALCDSIDSTGLYLYAPCGDVDPSKPPANATKRFECRQFPRGSGYPEDPATGIAAAALVASLYTRGFGSGFFEVYQGTALGRRSKIKLFVNENDRAQTEILCFGFVEVDSSTLISI